MKKIDWYIIKKFLGTFFLAIILINVIVIVFDISEKIDNFIENSVPFKLIITVYYFNFLPYFVNLFIALFTFIAVIFFTSKMAANTEIIAILSSGISFRRLLFPYVLSAIFLAIISFAFYNYIIPPANEKRINFELNWLKNKKKSYDRNIHLQTTPGTFLYVRNFNNRKQAGYKFTMEKFNQNEMYYKMMAHSITWDSITRKWSIKNYHIRLINGLEEKLIHGINMDTTLGGIAPEDFSSDVVDVSTMSRKKLNRFIEKEKTKGSPNINFYLLEKYKRVAFPFSVIILTLMGVALSSKKVRGGTGMHLGIGIALSFTYILFNQFASVFATYGNIPPKYAIWIPNLIFLFIAYLLIKKAPK